MLTPVLFLLAAVQQQPQPTQTPAIARIVVTPARPVVAAGDSLQLRAEAFDSAGRRVPDVRVRFAPAGGFFEGTVDSLGMVHAGAVGTLPVTAFAMVPGSRPVVNRLEVQMVAGPAARIELSARPTRLLVGQRARVDARVLSRAGSLRSADRVTWRSSAPAAVSVNEAGLVTAVAPGRATLTASSGAASERFDVEVLGAEVGSVDVTPSSTNARTGDVIRFKATARDRAGREIAGVSPTFLLGPGRAEIGEDGAFVGYEAGTYTVTASFGNRSADAVVTLAPRDVRRQAQVVGKVIRDKFLSGEVWIHPNGNVAYLTTTLGGDRVYTIDISNPASPQVVDSLMVNARTINDIMTTPDGKWAVVTREGADNRRNGVLIVDTSDPLRPKAVKEVTEGITAGIHSAFVYKDPKHGQHVYLTNDGTGEVVVMNIDDPRNPREVSRWAPRPSPAGRMLHDIDVQDGLLYGSWWNDGLVILDVGNGMRGGTPSAPKLVSQLKYDLDAIYKDVEAEGGKGFIRGTHTAWRHRNYVFVGDEVFGNTEMQKLGSETTTPRAHGRLHVVDVSDITKPKIVAWWEPEQGGVHNVWVAGDTLYVGAYNAGFHAFDVSGELRGELRAQGRELAQVIPADPKGKIPNSAMTWGVVVNPKDGLAYVNDMNSGLWIVRMMPRQNPVP